MKYILKRHWPEHMHITVGFEMYINFISASIEINSECYFVCLFVYMSVDYLDW